MQPNSREAVQAFWRMHIDGWRRSELTQRAYCAVHGLSRKSFCNWRARFKHEDVVAERKAVRRHRPRTSPSASPRTMAPAEATLDVPSPGRRRVFSEELKRQIVEETCRPGASVSAVARRHGLSPSVLFRWRDALGQGQSGDNTTFLAVQIDDGGAASTGPSSPNLEASSPPPSIIVERPSAEIEVELIGGRRLRFDRDVDPETVRRMVVALEGCEP